MKKIPEVRGVLGFHSTIASHMRETDKSAVVGAVPEGTSDARTSAQAVREMFTSIAPRYDLLNHLLSFSVDRVWWRRTARTFAHILRKPDARVLDLCCGTGDMTFALRRQAGSASPQILGAEFSPAMLQRALLKSAGMNASNGAQRHIPQLHTSQPNTPQWVEADALTLPLPDNHFDLITSAFGFRNLADYDAGLREIARVLRTGGECGILDFSEPQGLMGSAYRLYFRHILPRVGTMISGVRGPYAYLPASVERFPQPDEMLARMRAAGFREVSWTPYALSIAGLYRGTK
jgi:demethylmenaquinone methyltransferase / 2-methoxy-6-polyprenyl-1,4-benzoquinol methylase